MTISTSQNLKKKRPFEVLDRLKTKASNTGPTTDHWGPARLRACLLHLYYIICVGRLGSLTQLTAASVPSAHRMAQEQAQMLYHPHSTCAQMEINAIYNFTAYYQQPCSSKSLCRMMRSTVRTLKCKMKVTSKFPFLKTQDTLWICVYIFVILSC